MPDLPRSMPGDPCLPCLWDMHDLCTGRYSWCGCWEPECLPPPLIEGEP